MISLIFEFDGRFEAHSSSLSLQPSLFEFLSFRERIPHETVLGGLIFFRRNFENDIHNPEKQMTQKLRERLGELIQKAKEAQEVKIVVELKTLET